MGEAAETAGGVVPAMIETAEQARAVLARITFGAGLGLLRPLVTWGGYWIEGPCVVAVVNVPHRDDPFLPASPVMLPKHVGLPCTPETLVAAALCAFRELLDHEVCESIKFGGALVRDPHAFGVADPCRP